MKVYLASKFLLLNDIRLVSWTLEQKGISITTKWWLKDFKTALGEMSDEEWYNRIEVQTIRDRNFKGIDDADALILIAPQDKPTKFNGANVELGYAIARGKPVFSIGKLERSGMYRDVVQTKNLGHLIQLLKRLGVDG